MCSTYKQLCLGIVFFYLIKIGGGGRVFEVENPEGREGLKKFWEKKSLPSRGGGVDFFLE